MRVVFPLFVQGFAHVCMPRCHRWLYSRHGDCFDAVCFLAFLARTHRLVTFNNAAAADEAIKTLQETELMGRPIFLREDREEKGFGGGGGGGGGGFNGGGSAKCKVTNPAGGDLLHVAHLGLLWVVL